MRDLKCPTRRPTERNRDLSLLIVGQSIQALRPLDVGGHASVERVVVDP